MLRNKCVALLLICLFLGVTSCRAESTNLISEDLVQVNTANYQTVVAQYGTYEMRVTASASIYYPHSYDVCFDKAGAKIESFLVTTGEKVKKGDPLVSFVLDVDEVALESDHLALVRTREELERETETRQEEIAFLRESVYTSKDQFEREKRLLKLKQAELMLELTVCQLESRIDELEDSIRKREKEASENVLLAPVDGEVISIAFKHEGDLVHADEALITIRQTDRILMRVDDAVGFFRFGMEVDVEVGAATSRKVFSGRVIAADTLIPENEQTGYAYIEVEGATADADLLMPRISGAAYSVENVITIPKSAVKIDGGKAYVTKLVNGQPCKRYVSPVMQNNAQLWILQGIEPGEIIVVD